MVAQLVSPPDFPQHCHLDKFSSTVLASSSNQRIRQQGTNLVLLFPCLQVQVTHTHTTMASSTVWLRQDSGLTLLIAVVDRGWTSSSILMPMVYLNYKLLEYVKGSDLQIQLHDNRMFKRRSADRILIG